MQDWGASPATYISLAVGWGFKIFPWMCFVWLCLTSLFCLTLFNFSALFDFSAFHTSSLSACQQVLHSCRKRVHESKKSKKNFQNNGLSFAVLNLHIAMHCKAVQLIHLQIQCRSCISYAHSQGAGVTRDGRLGEWRRYLQTVYCVDEESLLVRRWRVKCRWRIS